MHRVELKEDKNTTLLASYVAFLMHRVELKVTWMAMCSWAGNTFLMHRVELKVALADLFAFLAFSVPNAPCGVES